MSLCCFAKHMARPELELASNLYYTFLLQSTVLIVNLHWSSGCVAFHSRKIHLRDFFIRRHFSEILSAHAVRFNCLPLMRYAPTARERLLSVQEYCSRCRSARSIIISRVARSNASSSSANGLSWSSDLRGPVGQRRRRRRRRPGHHSTGCRQQRPLSNRRRTDVQDRRRSVDRSVGRVTRR